MAITDVSICNSALMKIGAARINALSDTSKSAVICNEQYAKLRDEVLASHPWKFALKRASLAQTTAPVWGYAFAYALPADCLRIWKCENDDTVFEVEGKTVVCDDATLNVIYIAQITDTSYFTATFAEVLALRLAADLAYAVAQSQQLQQTMMQAYEQQLKTARSLSSQQGSPDQIVANDWINSRY